MSDCGCNIVVGGTPTDCINPLCYFLDYVSIPGNSEYSNITIRWQSFLGVGMSMPNKGFCCPPCTADIEGNEINFYALTTWRGLLTMNKMGKLPTNFGDNCCLKYHSLDGTLTPDILEFCTEYGIPICTNRVQQTFRECWQQISDMMFPGVGDAFLEDGIIEIGSICNQTELCVFADWLDTINANEFRAYQLMRTLFDNYQGISVVCDGCRIKIENAGGSYFYIRA